VVAGSDRWVEALCLICVGLAAAVLSTAAGTAEAASTRAEYVNQVDPICQAAHGEEHKTFANFNKRTKRLVRESVQNGTKIPKHGVRQVVHYYKRVARVELRLSGQIAAVPPLAADAAMVAEWLQIRNQWAALLPHAIQAAAHGRPKAFTRLVGKAYSAQDRAEALVESFGFRFCGHLPVF
jgi:hypothetical protein